MPFPLRGTRHGLVAIRLSRRSLGMLWGLRTFWVLHRERLKDRPDPKDVREGGGTTRKGGGQWIFFSPRPASAGIGPVTAAPGLGRSGAHLCIVSATCATPSPCNSSHP